MIKLGIRKNLIYPLLLMTSFILRELLINSMNMYLNFEIISNNYILLTLIMFLSEFIFGLIIFKYQCNYLKNEEAEKSLKFMGIKLIHISSYLKKNDTSFKIYFLILATAYYDFIDFAFTNLYLPEKDYGSSKSLNIRIRGSLVIFSALFSFLLLDYRIYRHQKCSLLTVFICFMIMIICESIINIFINNEKSGINFIIYLLLNLIHIFFYSILEIIEKYILEYDFINPFLLLTYEGAFGFIITLIWIIIKNPLKRTIEDFENVKKRCFIIIGLIIYFFLSGIINLYRLLTIKFFPPVYIAYINIFYSPFKIIYYYYLEKDFIIKGSKNVFYFIINLFSSIIIIFCGLIYNEFLIIFCFKLSYDTHYDISERANKDLFEYSLEQNNKDEDLFEDQ